MKHLAIALWLTRHSCVRALLPLAVAIFVLASQEKAAQATYKYCVTFTPTFVDSNKGEDYLKGGSMPAAHHYETWNAAGQMASSAYLNADGCFWTSLGTGKIRVFPIVKLGTKVFRAKLLTAGENQTYAAFTRSSPASQGGNEILVELPLGNFMADFFRASAVAMLSATSLMASPTDWTIVTQADTDAECGGAGACADAGKVFLGQDPNGIFYNQRKTVIAHELGHLVQESVFGWFRSPDASVVGDYSDVPSNSLFCSCWFVESPGDRGHCMGSREFLAAAFQEGFAHFFAARTLNNASEANAVFPYYKRMMTPASSQPVTCGQPGGACNVFLPPVSHNVLTAHRWLETQCTADTVQNRATEMDWLGLLYNLNVTQSYSGLDIQRIMLNTNTCGALCTSADEITWNELNASVNAQGAGFDDAKKLKFNTQSVAFGVKR